jgi:hypothetical protein
MKARPPQQEALLEEIRQIVAQYQAEVPGGRKAWPNAIKQRVARLKELGLSFKAISDQTGLPYFTVLGWRGSVQKTSAAGKFHQVSPDGAYTAATVAVATLSEGPVAPRARVAVATGTATVAVATPSGFRIEGLSLAQAIDVLGQLQ